MATKHPSKYRPIFYLFTFLFVWWSTPLVFKSFSRTFFYEFQAPGRDALSYLNDLQLFWSLRSHSKKDLIEAGKDLARLNNAYELSLNENSVLKSELSRLEKIFNLPPLPNFRYEIARVSHREINTWWQYFVIQKGKQENIKKGYGVIFAGGIVGRIKEVYSHSAIVELLSNPDFRMASKFENDGRPFTYQGKINTPFTNPLGEAKHLPPDIRVDQKKPRPIISSGLGGVFPEGLPIGSIYYLNKGKDGLFQKGKVRLDPKLLKLQEVAILIPLENSFDK